MADQGAGGTKLRRISADEFVRRLYLSADRPDTHYAFWLGAGCSTSCGIPGAATLVTKRWLPELRKVRGIAEQDFDEWIRKEFPGFDPENPAAVYGPVMEELFIQPEARQREIEELCEKRFPGFGYAVMATLMARDDGLFNVALTTNFDDLIADAMYVFSEARPLVIPDESLAAYIRPTRMRPLVVKVHGDHRLSPRNTASETGRLKEGISESIGNLLHDRGVIFVGYGGNDVGIAEMLDALPAQALPLGIWWASRTEPEGVLRGWLEQRNAIWVEIPGFDELMLLFKGEFSIPNPTSTKFDRLFSNYLSTYAELERQVGQIPDTDPQASSLKGAAARVEDSTTDWSALYMRAVRAETEDPAKAERLYRQGIAEFPRSVWSFVGLARLLGRLGRHAEALELSGKAVELEPDNRSAMLAYGEMLAIRGKMQDALATFETAVEQEPDAVIPRTYYGIFSARAGKGAEAAEQLAILLDPEQGPLTGGEVGAVALLADECGEYELALDLHERALAEDPDNASSRAQLARCLIALGRIDDARIEVAQALDGLSPSQSTWMMQCYFYEVVIGTRQQADAAIVALKKMISEGLRLTTWPLGSVVAAARREGNSDADWIDRLAEVIGNRKDPSELDAWPRWHQAG